MTEVTIAFPGIGIPEFTIDKIAFSIGAIEVRWYGIILTLGIIAGVLYAMYRGRLEGISSDDVLDFTLLTVFLAIIGARLYYVLTTLKNAYGEWNYHGIVDVIRLAPRGNFHYFVLVKRRLQSFCPHFAARRIINEVRVICEQNSILKSAYFFFVFCVSCGYGFKNITFYRIHNRIEYLFIFFFSARLPTTL